MACLNEEQLNRAVVNFTCLYALSENINSCKIQYLQYIELLQLLVHGVL